MRARLALLALALVAALAPVADAKPKPPTIAASTFVVGYQTASVEVTVPRGAYLVARQPAGRVVPGFATFADQDPEWQAVAIFARSAPQGAAPFRAVQVHPVKPDHCPSPVALTTPPPPCEKTVEHAFISGSTPTEVGGTLRYPMPAGTYQIVVSAPSRTFAIAGLTFGGVKGVRGLSATSGRASGTLQRTRAEDVAFTHAGGSFSTKLTGKGLAVLGLWHAAAGDEPGEFTYGECVTPGPAGPVNPDDCVAVGLTGQTPPDPLGRKPAFWRIGGGFPQTSLGTETFVTPVLDAGTYTNSYRLTRGGRGPAVGAFVWWVQADSLR